MTHEPFVDVGAVKAHTGLPESWIYDHAKNGDFPSYKVGHYRRFLLSEVDEYMRRHRERPIRAEKKEVESRQELARQRETPGWNRAQLLA